jgi:hypothetical protein
MVIPRSDIVVFHETTNGPFQPGASSIFASWAPEEGDGTAVQRYLAAIEGIIAMDRASETAGKKARGA